MTNSIDTARLMVSAVPISDASDDADWFKLLVDMLPPVEVSTRRGEIVVNATELVLPAHVALVTTVNVAATLLDMSRAELISRVSDALSMQELPERP